MPAVSPQIEPFFVSVSLLDIREGRKVSADFHVDLNHEVVRQMLSSSAGAGDQGSDRALQENGPSSPVEKKTEDCQLSSELENWLRFPKQVTAQEPLHLDLHRGYVCVHVFMCLITPAGHFFHYEPTYRHCDGGTGGESVDGKYFQWCRDLH